MEYKVGDKVRIKDLDWYNDNKDDIFGKVWCANGHIPFDKGMCKYCGKVMTISHVRADHYTMVEDLAHYWTDDMIECKVEEETKPKFKVGDRVYSKYHKPSIDLEIVEVTRGDGGYGYRIKNHQTNGAYFMLEYEMGDYKFVKEETKSHNNMCKQLIDEMNPNVEVNVKTKPEPKFKVGDIITKAHLRFRIVAVAGDKYVVEDRPGIYLTLLFNSQDDYTLREEVNKPIDLTVKGEEVKERIEIAIPEGYEYVIDSDKIIFTKKKKEYPKTFEECVSVLMLKGGNRMSLEQMNTFRKLIDARNAYWTIYGEENGLGKPWGPDWSIRGYYAIAKSYGKVIKTSNYNIDCTFVFPTEEMRDEFYENFKEEIEICKELL